MANLRNKLIVVFLLVVIIQSIFAVHVGRIIVKDSIQYSDWSDYLMVNGFNYAKFLQNNTFEVPLFLYLGYISIVALVKLLLGKYWFFSMIAMNIIFSGLTAVLISDLSYKITKSKLAFWTAAFFYMCSYEIFQWSAYLLSDSIFAFLAFFIYYLLINVLIDDNLKNSGFTWMGVGLLLIFATIFRPTGFLLAAIVFPAFIAWVLKKKRVSIPKSFYRNGAIFFVSLVGILIFVHAEFIKDFYSFIHKNQFAGSGFLRTLKDLYVQGAVINFRAYTYHNAPVSLADYILITFDKFLHFFYFSSSGYSCLHNLLNFIYFSLLYILVAFCVGQFIFGQDKKADMFKAVVRLSLFFILVSGLFHSLTILDFDWRYRLPIMPHFILLASIGIIIVRDLYLKFLNENRLVRRYRKF